MASCCWEPIPYAGQAYLEGQMANVTWFEDHGDFYCPGAYFDSPLVLTRENAVSAFFTDRPTLFPTEKATPSMMSTSRSVDVFGELRDALATLLFTETSHVRRVRLGS